MIKLPGLIDIHVHTRDPGAVYKEDFASCTAAALAGGITMIFAMPNTNPAVVDHQSFALAKEVREKREMLFVCRILATSFFFFSFFQRALSNARCDYAIYVGASSDNHNITAELAPLAAGLKMYLNETFTTLRLSDLTAWIKVSLLLFIEIAGLQTFRFVNIIDFLYFFFFFKQHFQSWPKKYPLCVHAEGQTTAAILLLAGLHNRPIHVCHVARKEEIQIIRAAKEKVCCSVITSFILCFSIYDNCFVCTSGNGCHLRGVSSSFVPMRGRS